MRTITRYLADDGFEFDSEEQCLMHEAFTKQEAEVIALLPPKHPHLDKKESGTVFFQHDVDLASAAHIEILTLFADRFDTLLGDILETFYTYQRLLSEFNHPRINKETIKFMSRLDSMDIQGREWEQPYYACHPNERAKQINPEK